MSHTIRLKSGSLIDAASRGGVSIPAPDQLVKKTILVHAGEFQSMDGPIQFDQARIQRLVQNHNTQIQSLAESYGGLAQMPLGAFPPILEDHEEKNQKIIGRLSGLLEYAELNIPGVGQKVPAAVAPVTFIGKENTVRVLDGRIYHVSIGINTESDTLSETSVVVTPAAPGAMLLARGKVPSTPSPTKQGEKPMPHAAKKAALPEERKARLQALRGEIDQVNRTIKTSQDQLRLKAKEGKITHRLKAAVSSGRLTPAELKKIMDDGDVKRLASLSEEASELMLKMIEKRQPVIEPGQRGSLDSLEGGQVAKEVGLKRLKAETRADILGKARLKKMEGSEPAKAKENPFEKKAKHLEDAGEDDKDVTEMSGRDVAGASDTAVVGDEAQSKLAELEGQVAQLQALVAKLMDEVKLTLDEEGEEEKELSSDEDKDKEKLAAEDDESEKDPADKKPEDEKK